jgi:hypothetical protein
VTDYLQLQGRFRHMPPEDIKVLQRWVCNKYYWHFGHEAEQPVCALFKGEPQMHFDGDPLHGV